MGPILSAFHVGNAAPSKGLNACSAPSDLSAAERVYWDYFAAQIAGYGRLSAATRGVLTAYCTSQATIARLRNQIAKDGHCDVSEFGTKSALLPELREWIHLARLLESDLLLSPASIMRAPQSPEALDDPFAEFDLPTRPSDSRRKRPSSGRS